MQLSRAQEQFSFAYITAVASQARIQVELRRLDDDGIDGILISTEGTEPRIEFQAKSTYSNVERADRISYPLDVSAYNRLVKETTTPRILIVMIVPSCPTKWIDQDQERLVTYRCAYWAILRGQSPTTNKQKKTISVPKTQIFSPEELRYLIKRADAGDLDD